MKPVPTIEYTPCYLSLKDWSQKCVKFSPYSPDHKKSLTTLTNPSSAKIFIMSTTFHLPHLHLSIFAIYFNNTLHISNYVLETSQKWCTIASLLHALHQVPTTTKVISIFYLNKTFPSYATNTYASPTLDLSSTLINAFNDLLTDEHLSFTGFWFLKAWAGAWTQDW
jgi:hypothetical protein